MLGVNLKILAVFMEFITSLGIGAIIDAITAQLGVK